MLKFPNKYIIALSVEQETIMNNFDWDKIRKALDNGVVLVTFKKKSDGTLRTMECTLAEYLLPETSGNSKQKDGAMLTVFDIQKEAWRCFYKDTVTDVVIL